MTTECPAVEASVAAAQQPAGRLRTLTIPLDDTRDMAGLLDYLIDDDVLCWTRLDGGLVGFGEVRRVVTSGAHRFEAAEQWWLRLMSAADVDDRVGLPGTGPMAFGSFAFSASSGYQSRLIVPSLVIGSLEGRGWLTQLTTDDDVDLSPAGAEAELARWLEDEADASEPLTPGRGRLEPGALTEQQWVDAVSEGISDIDSGELDKIVLARDVVVRTEAEIGAAQVLRELSVRYRECWTYAVDGLIGSTPEMLIQVTGDTARARVLAGTLDRSGAPADDPQYAQRVLAGSAKQRREHGFAIESLIRTLEPFATSLTAHSEPFVLELPNVWHLASDVWAQLGHEATVPSPLTLAAALHPTAAVCGTPTEAAAAAIARLEHMDRGPDAGPVGWLDAAGNGEWGIALRGAVIEDRHRMRLFAGCGIVADSDPSAELAETWSKFRPMLQALDMRATSPSGDIVDCDTGPRPSVADSPR